MITGRPPMGGLPVAKSTHEITMKALLQWGPLGSMIKISELSFSSFKLLV